MNFQKTFPLRYFMNLRTRLDRRLETERQFENAELEVARFPAIDANWLRSRKGYQTKNKYACGLTKQLIIRRALLSDAEAVFIFEDDIILHSRLQELLANIELPDVESGGLIIANSLLPYEIMMIRRDTPQIGVSLICKTKFQLMPHFPI